MKPLGSMATLLVVSAAMFANIYVQARELSGVVAACRSDVQNLCPKVQPGSGRIAECLQQHATELSAPCKEQLVKVKQCSEQVKTLCAASGSDKAALRTCMKEHASELGQACKTQ